MTDTVEAVRLEPFDPELDADLVAGWLRAPHVAEWWGDPQQNLAEVLQRPAGGDDALIVADGVPVGYVRWQKPTRAELDTAGLYEIPDTAMDIDIAIGEPSYVGRGVGSRALRQVVAMLAGDTGIPLIMLATSVGNSVAIRAYEKAGFRRLRRFDDPPNGEHWLMALEPPR